VQCAAKFYKLLKPMQRKESALLRLAKVIVLASSFIGLVTIWGITYYFLEMAPQEDNQVLRTQVVFTKSACDRVEDNEVVRGDCYLKVAKARRNETICGEIVIPEIKSLCYVQMAQLKNDIGICEKNEITPSLKDACDGYFLKKREEAASFED